MAAPSSTPFNRFMRGPTSTAAYPAASGYQINQGDLTVFFSGNLYPANSVGLVLSWNSGNEIQNWSGARAIFAGPALGQANSYNVTSGSVPTYLDGIFQYPFVGTSGTSYQPGQFVSFAQADPANPSNSGYFANQAIMVCSGQATAIGKIVEIFPATASGQGMLVVAMQSFLAQGAIAN